MTFVITFFAIKKIHSVKSGFLYIQIKMGIPTYINIIKSVIRRFQSFEITLR